VEEPETVVTKKKIVAGSMPWDVPVLIVK